MPYFYQVLSADWGLDFLVNKKHCVVLSAYEQALQRLLYSVILHISHLNVKAGSEPVQGWGSGLREGGAHLSRERKGSNGLFPVDYRLKATPNG